MNPVSSFARLLFLCVLAVFTTTNVFAQARNVEKRALETQNVQYDNQGRVIPNTRIKGGDSLQSRNSNADSITIFYRYFDSSRIHFLDSSINDFTRRYPVPAHYVHVGNFGTAARSLVFNPNLRPGWDPSFHAYDNYKFTIENTKFYQTTRPYTELGYMLGSQQEQMVDILHTQNVNPNFNLGFQYRFINAPGEFRSQNASHNNVRLHGSIQSKNKRYTAYAAFISNKSKSSENGGLRSDTSLEGTEGFNNPFVIPTRLGGTAELNRNFFSTLVNTGNVYTERTVLYRHQYDLGQKDSIIVNDSTTIQLFYPRIRFQHTFSYNKYDFLFQDYRADSSDYHNFFNYPIRTGDTILFNDVWKELKNDFSIVSFPQKNNLNQFLKAGLTVQNLSTVIKGGTKRFLNIAANGEYRNRTRNKKWEVEAVGVLHLSGLNSGDYSANVLLKKFLNPKLGNVELGFLNVNRTPSSLLSGQTNFPVKPATSFNKENITRLRASVNNEPLRFTLTANYYLVSNYTYMDSFFHSNQESTLFNVLHVSGEKIFVLRKFKSGIALNLYSEVHLQKTAGNPPLNLPLIFTRNRLLFEGVFARNMVFSTGVEIRYHTPYKADNYSPFVGQFFYQGTQTINNRPEINLVGNFRIKSFNAFVRYENLNAFDVSNGNAGFSRNNFAAPNYPYPGGWLRVGIWWRFIN